MKNIKSQEGNRKSFQKQKENKMEILNLENTIAKIKHLNGWDEYQNGEKR